MKRSTWIAILSGTVVVVTLAVLAISDVKPTRVIDTNQANTNWQAIRSGEGDVGAYAITNTDRGKQLVRIESSGGDLHRLTEDQDVLWLHDMSDSGSGGDRLLYGRGYFAPQSTENPPIEADLWLWEESKSTASKLTQGHKVTAARFSPDGTAVSFLTAEDELFLLELGSLKERLLGRQYVGDLEWSGDSRRLLLSYYETPGSSGTGYGSTGGGIVVLDTRTAGRLFMELGAAPHWSATGREIIFYKDRALWAMDASGNNVRRLGDKRTYGPESPILWVKTDRLNYLYYNSYSTGSVVRRLVIDKDYKRLLEDEIVSEGSLSEVPSLTIDDLVPIITKDVGTDNLRVKAVNPETTDSDLR